MNIQNLHQINYLAQRRTQIVNLMFELNRINSMVGGESELLPSIPKAVLDVVDTRLAAKGLLSLVIESLAETESQLESYGVDLREPKRDAA